MKKIYLLILSLLAWADLSAVITINEIFVNPPGTDDDQEFLEFRESTNTSVTIPANTYFVVIDGDGGAAGSIDKVFLLSGYTTGTNGLLLLRDANTVLSPAPDPATSVQVLVNAFNPNIENGSQTYALITATTAPLAGTDLDMNNDGVLDAGIPAGWTVLEAVSYVECQASLGGDCNGGTEYTYALQLLPVGGVEFPSGPFTPDALIKDASGNWIGLDVTSPGTTGPYTYDPTEIVDAAGNPVGGLNPTTLTPGVSTNFTLPAELGGFTVETQDGISAFLSWTTLSESGPLVFEVQHQLEGNDFETIGQVDGIGFQEDRSVSYTYRHANLEPGQHMYRLRITDLDGEEKYSSVKTLTINGADRMVMYPTFTQGPVTLRLTAQTTSVQITVATADGKVVQQYAQQYPEWESMLDISGLPSGMYQVWVRTPEQQARFQVVKQ
ncbi:MAG: T9SS type A sorting domain-containing protein [Bacteroidota bacterium]